MEWRKFINKGFWIGLVVGVVGAIMWNNIDVGYTWFINGFPFMILTLINKLIPLGNTISPLYYIMMLIIPAIYGMIINLIYNKIQTPYRKWIFIIFSIIIYVGGGFILMILLWLGFSGSGNLT